MREPWSSNSTLPALEIWQSISEISEDGKSRVTKELDEVTPTGSADNSFSSGTAFEKMDIKSGETSARTVMPNQIVADIQRSASPSGPAVMLLSRGDNLYHRLTRLYDTLIVQTDIINLHASWDWDPTNLTDSTSGSSITQDNCWVQVKWLSHGGHITGGGQDVNAIDLETLSSTPGQLQERILEGGSALSQKALSVQKGEHVLVIQYCLERPQYE